MSDEEETGFRRGRPAKSVDDKGVSRHRARKENVDEDLFKRVMHMELSFSIDFINVILSLCI